MVGVIRWTDEMAIDFLLLLKNKPVLWHPEAPTININSDQQTEMDSIAAWESIKMDLCYGCSVQELKRKRDHLMGVYKMHATASEMRKSTGSEGKYESSWFAFDTMHSFLGNIRPRCSGCPACQTTTETVASENVEQTFNQIPEENQEVIPLTERHMDEISALNKDNKHSSEYEQSLECKLLVQKLVQKLAKIKKHDRINLMKKIYHLVDQTLVSGSVTCDAFDTKKEEEQALVSGSRTCDAFDTSEEEEEALVDEALVSGSVKCEAFDTREEKEALVDQADTETQETRNVASPDSNIMMLSSNQSRSNGANTPLIQRSFAEVGIVTSSEIPIPENLFPVTTSMASIPQSRTSFEDGLYYELKHEEIMLTDSDSDS